MRIYHKSEINSILKRKEDYAQKGKLEGRSISKQDECIEPESTITQLQQSRLKRPNPVVSPSELQNKAKSAEKLQTGVSGGAAASVVGFQEQTKRTSLSPAKATTSQISTETEATPQTDTIVALKQRAEEVLKQILSFSDGKELYDNACKARHLKKIDIEIATFVGVKPNHPKIFMYKDSKGNISECSSSSKAYCTNSPGDTIFICSDIHPEMMFFCIIFELANLSRPQQMDEMVSKFSNIEVPVEERVKFIEQYEFETYQISGKVTQAFSKFFSIPWSIIPHEIDFNKFWESYQYSDHAQQYRHQCIEELEKICNLIYRSLIFGDNIDEELKSLKYDAIKDPEAIIIELENANKIYHRIQLATAQAESQASVKTEHSSASTESQSKTHATTALATGASGGAAASKAAATEALAKSAVAEPQAKEIEALHQQADQILKQILSLPEGKELYDTVCKANSVEKIGIEILTLIGPKPGHPQIFQYKDLKGDIIEQANESKACCRSSNPGTIYLCTDGNSEKIYFYILFELANLSRPKQLKEVLAKFMNYEIPVEERVRLMEQYEFESYQIASHITQVYSKKFSLSESLVPHKKDFHQFWEDQQYTSHAQNYRHMCIQRLENIFAYIYQAIDGNESYYGIGQALRNRGIKKPMLAQIEMDAAKQIYQRIQTRNKVTDQ